MEYTSFVDTSLDLNFNPSPKQQGQSNSADFRFNKPAVKHEVVDLVEELNRVRAENKKLTQMLTLACENYNSLQTHLADYMSKNPAAASCSATTGNSRKRKLETAAGNSHNFGAVVDERGNSESSSSDEDSCKKIKEEEHIKNKISRVCVRTESSDPGLVVKDGYQWRKYGQKVTRDNPCPRAYFKCSFAPTCPVKKKVQKSIEDQSILVATYEGEHNHPPPSSKHEHASPGLTRTMLGSDPSPASQGLAIAPPNLVNPSHSNEAKVVSDSRSYTPEFQQFLIDQMASSLTKDPSFKAALAAAISGRIVQQNQSQKL